MEKRQVNAPPRTGQTGKSRRPSAGGGAVPASGCEGYGADGSGTRKPLHDARFLEHLFPGDSELSRLMRGLDWTKTDLGAPETWPEHWRTAVRLCLTSRIPVVMYWGRNFTVLYNDPYISFLGETKHPRFLGRPGHECWSEIWDTIGPMLQSVYATRKATWSEDLLMFFARALPLEEVYVRFTFGPLMAADGTVDGIFCPCTETTERVVAERRLETLRKLSVQAATAQTVVEACSGAVAALADNQLDIPFAGVYVADDSGTEAVLSASTGFPPGFHSLPLRVSPTEPDPSPWPLASVLRSRRSMEAAGLDILTPPLPSPWAEPTTSVIVLPIPAGGHETLAGLLVVGVSPRRVLDAAYRSFFELVAGHIGTAIADARAYEAERKRAEALAELDRAKTAFFSNVSHEFRTPLTLMLGPVEEILAQHKEPLSAENRELLAVVHRNGLRLQKLVNTLLDFSRIEAGRVQVLYEPTDLATVTTDLVSNFRSACERAGLSLVVDCPPLPEPVYVDREMWEKIVLNLVSNAFKFTFKGQITVTLRRAQERVELVVSDTGSGIPPSELPHIFERFHRVRGAHGRTHEGTGIGLALVHELVKLHGGTIAVASEPSKGTSFTVTIPLGRAHLPADRVGSARTESALVVSAASYVEEALRWLGDNIPTEPPASVPLGRATQRAHIVVADDNADMREYVCRLLGRYWTVSGVSDGQAALDAIRVRRPDLVLADVMMPRLDGFGLLRALRNETGTADIPVVLLSARAGEESRVEGLDAGADDYLVKPFSARELVARVNAHIELARVRREALSREQAARAEAEQANRAKDAFLATLSHELRTPLNAILGWAAILNRAKPDADSMQRGLEVIERNAKAQTRLIEDLLDVSRIVTGKMRLDVRPVDLIAVINAAIDSVRPAASAKGIRLQPILDPKAGTIAGDPDRLLQVLWNLMSNAVKFTPKGGRVQIRLERVNSHIEAVVSDTGCGIPAETLPAIFDRFMQADSTSSRRHGGLGLGLALVKHLVELHGGTVRAESDGPDKGATFIVKLPLMARVAEAAAREHPTARRVETPAIARVLAGKRLLIVDDESDTLELFAKIFADQGADVTVAASAAQALERIATTRPDVLICDIEMPDEDGYALIQKVRSLAPQDGGSVPAVAVTAYGSVEDRIRILSAGFQMHVPKPVEPAELVAVVARVAVGTGR